tara:strand:- start:234 stop:818 length:585 start_codon:yes stop_codon:yes gene_type:complete
MIKEKRQSQIMQATMKVVTRKGYSQTRIDDIAKESGLSKGAIYHYYNDKKEIFLSLIDHWETETFPDFYKKNKDRTSIDILKSFAEKVSEVYKKRKYVFQAEVEFWALANQDSDINKKSFELYEKILNLFELVIKKGIREGYFKKVDPRIKSIYILSVFQGINWFCIFNNKNDDAEKYIDESIKSIISELLIEN